MNNTLRACAAMLALAGLAGCASSPQQENDPAFGNSVRQMISAQIHDPGAAARAGTDAPSGLDGARAENVIKAYRADVDKPAKAQEAMQMQIAN